jgi:putative peptidoglycan lipid II flippase
VLTALFPTMSRHHAAGDGAAYGRAVASGLRAIAFFALVSGAALVALAVPVAHTVRFAEFSESGAAHVASALRAFAPGVLGYGAFLFLARACYATGDTRTPALVNFGVVLGGAVAMAVAVSAAGDAHVVAAIAGAVSGIYLIGSGVLLVLLARRHPGVLTGVARGAVAALGASLAAGVAMWAVHVGISGTTRSASAAAIMLGGSLGVVVYLGVGAALGGPRPSTLPALLRGQG